MTSPDLDLVGVYDYRLVALSVLIAILACYAALDLAGRVTSAQGKARLLWLNGGAVAMGFGIWSMHYIGMLAFRLPIPVQYDWPTVLLSLVAAVVASGVALFVVSRHKMGAIRAVLGSIFMGSGIATMHYTGMAAMRLSAICSYSGTLVTLSVVLAIVISFVALWLTFYSRGETTAWSWRKVHCALVMGAAIPVMHYTGMAAASFTASPSVHGNRAHAISVSSLSVAGVTIVTLTVLGIVLLTSLADRRLQRSEERLRLLVQGVKDYAILMLDAEGRITTWNEGAERIKGYRAEEIIGEHFSKFYTPEDLATDKPSQELKIAAEQGLFEEEGWRVRKDGSRFWATVLITALRGENGRLRGFSEITRDVTAGKKTEAALRASEIKFRGILESAPDAMVIADGQGRIVLVNAETERLFGYRREELVGQVVDILVPERFRGKHPRHREGYTEHPVTRSMGAGLDLWGLRKDNTEFPVEISLSPIETPGGTLISSTIRDVTTRKKAEESLREAEEHFRTLANNISQLAWMADEKGYIFWYNQRWFDYTGTTLEEMAGWGWQKVHHPDHVQQVVARISKCFQTGEVWEDTFPLRGRDGNYRWFLSRAVPIRDPEGKVLRWFGTNTDITERKKSEEHLLKTVEELKRSNDELQQFAYVASHDLQEPLRMVASYTQLLAKRYKGRLDSDADEFIAYAVDGSNRMQRLIQDLLAYSRAGTNGKALLEISSEKALKEALANLRATMQESGAVVTHDSLPAITTDDTQLAQIFQNLVGNAIKYRSAKAPLVHVSAAKNGGKEWIFSVRDNGMGIDPQYFERIFVLFQRLHGRTEFKGTGIGLAICKKILERLGGRIWVESQPEKGSTFHFALPERDGK
jgi:PAS domain S-box-containing protein